MVDTGGLFIAALILVAIPFAIRDARRRQGRERTLASIATVAVALLAGVFAAKALGWLSEGPFYDTARLSLGALWLAMYFQIMRFGKRSV
jgi:hypothetical protein